MDEIIPWIGTIGIALAFLVALAGAGWWRLSVALVVSALIAAIAAAGVGFVVWRVSLSFEHGGGGEWRGLGAFVMAGFATGATLLIVFIVTMILIGVLKRPIFRRGRASLVVLGISALLLTVGVGAFVIDTPQHSPTRLLVEKVVNSGASKEDTGELARRGHAALPTILSELHRHPYSKSDHSGPSQVPQLLRVLGSIGGAEANAELHKWAESDVYEGIRVAAVRALAAQGDRSAIPLAAQFLARDDGQWPWQRSELIEIFGQLKAVDQVGVIRDTLIRGWSQSGSQMIAKGIAALVTINTDEAWAAIRELGAQSDKQRRSDVLTALQNHPGQRTLELAAKALDDPEASVRESAFWTIYRVEPKLFTGIPFGWSEENERRLRGSLQPRISPPH